MEEKRAKQVVATLNVLQLSLLNQEKMLSYELCCHVRNKYNKINYNLPEVSQKLAAKHAKASFNAT